MMNLVELLRENRAALCGRRLLFVHAHPDDETLQTGTLIAMLRENKARVDLVTCTRGEQGEVVQGVLPANITPDDLVRAREAELEDACNEIGVSSRFFLGEPPARVRGKANRKYSDSGMRWLSPGVAGPAEDAPANSLTMSSIDEVVDDLKSAITEISPDAVLSYDAGGSYNHPDHVRTHEITKLACAELGTPFYEIASGPAQDGFDYFDLSEYLPTLRRALGHYRTQLTVCDDHVRHVGGNTEEFHTRIGLRYLP